MKLVRRFSAVLAVCGWFAWGSLGAAPVSVDSCLQAAMQNSPALASEMERIHAAEQAYAKERDRLLPVLALSDQEGYSIYKPEAGFINGTENLANAELSVDLQPWLASPDGLAHLEIQRGVLRLAQVRAKLRREVIRSFDALMVLRLKSEEGKNAVDFVDSHIKDIQRLHALGVDVELDLLRAGSQRRSLDLEANGHDAETLNTLAGLRSLTGMDLHLEDFQPDGAWIDAAIKEAAVSGSAEQAQLLGTLEARAADLDLESARLATFGTGALSAPTLKVGLNHGVLSIDPATPLDQAYAQVSINAFDWGQRAAEGRQRAAEFVAQQGDTREQLRQLGLATEQLANDRVAASRAYEISVGLLSDAQQAMAIAGVYYRQGKIKETDLLSVFSDYLAAVSQRNSALQTVLEKDADWKMTWEGARP